MSILIKRMDMPKEGEMHRINIYDNGNVYVTTINRLYETEMKDIEAIQIPTPHGRLIDASELDKCWEEKEDISEDVDYKILYKCVLAISKYAPTILEAEE